jgi:hypothetical protein
LVDSNNLQINVTIDGTFIFTSAHWTDKDGGQMSRSRKANQREPKLKPPTAHRIPKCTVEQLLAVLREMPMDAEVVIYPKYTELDPYHSYPFDRENVQENNIGQISIIL